MQNAETAPGVRALPLTRDRAAASLAVLRAIDEGASNWTDAMYLAELPGKWELSVLCCRGEQGCAYALLSRKEGGAAHVHRFFVAPGERSRGLGRVLMDAVKARAAGERRITLKVHPDNAGAVAFYLREGFRAAGMSGEYQVMDYVL